MSVVLSGSEFERSTHNLEPATQKIRRLKSALKFFVTDYGLKSVARFALGCVINCGLKSILPSSVHASKRDLFLRLAETFHSLLAIRCCFGLAMSLQEIFQFRAKSLNNFWQSFCQRFHSPVVQRFSLRFLGSFSRYWLLNNPRDLNDIG
ncbi:MAG: hypothetical protein RRA51_03410 [Armatimonadota bacterium]|nr:hypothetical protein [Armatimonadota bacterium]